MYREPGEVSYCHQNGIDVLITDEETARYLRDEGLYE